MISASEMLARFGEQHVAGFMLVLARISPLFVLAPLFSSRALPMRARVVVAVALAVGLLPVALKMGGAAAADVPLDPITYVGLMFKELLVGMAFAFTLGALFHAVSTAGSLLDTLIGFSYGALVDPMTGAQASVLAQLYSLVGIGIFIAINGDAWVVQGLAKTYELVPLTAAPELGPLVQGAVTAFTGVFVAALQVCAPVLLAIVITDAAVGVVSKVMPQLNVFAVGFPAKVAVGLILVGASLPFVAGHIHDELQASVAAALDALEIAG